MHALRGDGGGRGRRGRAAIGSLPWAQAVAMAMEGLRRRLAEASVSRACRAALAVRRNDILF